MAASSRTAQINKLHKVLKKHYKPVSVDPSRPVLEHLLLACCLENAHYEPAEEALAALVHTFFDWNEIRVSTIRELSEAMACLPDPPAAASRVKRVLQDVFEADYSFDLEDLWKLNLGPAIERLTKLDGTTSFSVSYVVQSALGGHAIPIDSATLQVLRLLDLITDEDVAAGVVPGLDRAIPKSRGIEFGSLLHQLAADFVVNPYAPALREILLQINPDVKDRLPKRRRVRKAKQPAGDEPPAEAADQEAKSRAKSQAKSTRRAKKKAAEAAPEAAAPASETPAKGKSAGRGKRTAKSTEKTAGKGKGRGGSAKGSSSRISKRKPR